MATALLPHFPDSLVWRVLSPPAYTGPGHLANKPLPIMVAS